VGTEVREHGRAVDVGACRVPDHRWSSCGRVTSGVNKAGNEVPVKRSRRTMSTPAFAERLRELVAAAAAHDEVVGVIGFGSTAERSRADEWSDHDLALITAPGHEAPLRRALDWVPHPERVVLAIVDRYDAVTVMWDAGEVLE